MATASEVEIVDLDELVARLPRAERTLFERLFHIAVTYGRLVPP
jgi:hypothetical protein